MKSRILLYAFLVSLQVGIIFADNDSRAVNKKEIAGDESIKKADDEETFGILFKKLMNLLVRKCYFVSSQALNKCNDYCVCLIDKGEDVCTYDEIDSRFKSSDYEQLKNKLKPYYRAIKSEFDIDNYENIIKENKAQKKEISNLQEKIFKLQMGLVIAIIAFVGYEGIQYYRSSDSE